MRRGRADRRFRLLIEAPERLPRDADALSADVGALRGLRRVAKGTLKKARAGALLAARAHPLALSVEAAKGAGKLAAVATGPLRRKIFRAFFGTLVTRRARALAYARRGTLMPTPAERREADAWARAYIRRKGLFGKLAATVLSGEIGAEPVTSALVTASVPLLLQLARKALKVAEHEGAPADPRGSARLERVEEEEGANEDEAG